MHTPHSLNNSSTTRGPCASSSFHLNQNEMNEARMTCLQMKETLLPFHQLNQVTKNSRFLDQVRICGLSLWCREISGILHLTLNECVPVKLPCEPNRVELAFSLTERSLYFDLLWISAGLKLVRLHRTHMVFIVLNHTQVWSLLMREHKSCVSDWSFLTAAINRVKPSWHTDLQSVMSCSPALEMHQWEVCFV